MLELPDDLDLDITELDFIDKDLTECYDLSRYTKLVKLNIQSLVEVLNVVDKKLTQNIATLSVPTDTGIIDEITKPVNPTNPIPPKTTNPTLSPVVNNSCQVESVTYSP